MYLEMLDIGLKRQPIIKDKYTHFYGRKRRKLKDVDLSPGLSLLAII